MARRGGTGGRSTPAAPQRMTKAERKEQARKDRLELVRRQAKTKRRRRIGLVVGAIVVAAAVAVIVVLSVTGGGLTKRTVTDPRTLPGVLTTQATAAHPWPANATDEL